MVSPRTSKFSVDQLTEVLEVLKKKPVRLPTKLNSDTFIEDLGPILVSCVEGKKCKAFYEIDKEFEIKMTVWKVTLSVFVTKVSFLCFIVTKENLL